MSEGCARSHPHEEMDCCCKHKTEIARANHRISVLEGKRWHYPAHNLDLDNLPAPGEIVVVYYRNGEQICGPVVMGDLTETTARRRLQVNQSTSRLCDGRRFRRSDGR